MLYNKYYKNNYEELITYYPKFYREVLEMRAILEAEGKLADDIENNIECVFNNCFIDTADEITIRKLEEFLGLKLYRQRSLEDRRRLVKSLFVGNGKISASMISEMISAYTGAKVSCTFEPYDELRNNMLYINFERGSEKTLYTSDILSLLEKRIPAHIKYRTAVVYSFPIGIGRNRKYYKYDHELCGTKPETATAAEKYAVSSVIQQRHTNSLKTYRASADIYNEAGTEPAVIKIGQKFEYTTKANETHINSLKNYPASSDMHNESGRIPVSSSLAAAKMIDTASGGTFTSADVNYIPCGTIFTHS